MLFHLDVDAAAAATAASVAKTYQTRSTKSPRIHQTQPNSLHSHSVCYSMLKQAMTRM